MSAALVKAVQGHIRSQFTQQQLLTVDLYGGEFNSTEIEFKSFACPAVLIACLGWQPRADRGRRARDVRLGAFVVTKHPRREDRMLEASTLAEALSLVLPRWRPAADPAGEIDALDDPPTAENLYSRSVDAKGLALWLVSWEQTFVPAPSTTVADLYDLVRVEIQDTTQQGHVPTSPAPAGTLVVTEQVDFNTPI